MRVRSKGADAVVRYAGRRLRVTTVWAEISDEAIPRLQEALGDDLEVESKAAPSPAVEPIAEEPKPKRRKSKKDDDLEEDVTEGED